MLLKVKDNEHLVKDTRTGAILNTDRSIIAKHEMMVKEQDKEKRREDEINKLKADISDIKTLLLKLIENG